MSLPPVVYSVNTPTQSQAALATHRHFHFPFANHGTVTSGINTVRTNQNSTRKTEQIELPFEFKQNDNILSLEQ